eukprot:scaffold22177_cov31-Tisochrysis_lutea.AAC.2
MSKFVGAALWVELHWPLIRRSTACLYLVQVGLMGIVTAGYEIRAQWHATKTSLIRTKSA